MAKQKKPRNKAYKQRVSSGTLKLSSKPWRVKNITAPLESILDQLEQSGTIDEISGQPVFKDCRSGKWCDSVSGILGCCEMYEIHERRTGDNLCLEPLRQLANKLKYSMPIFAADTEAARGSVNRLRDATLEMTESYSIELLNDFKLKVRLEAATGRTA